MLKILLFLLFLVAYVFWALASAWTSKMIQKGSLAGESFWASELLMLELIAGFFGFIYLLSGLWNLALVLLLLAASQLGMLLPWCLNAVTAGNSDKARIRQFWAANELQKKHRTEMNVLLLLAGGTSLLYVVAAGFEFFRYPWGSQVLQILVVRSSLILNVLGGFILTWYVNVSMLASENLDDDTRQRLLITQIGAAVPMVVYAALALWAYGFGGSQVHISLKGLPALTYSLEILIMMLLFAAIALVPYLVGSRRARRKNLELLERRKTYVVELVEILEAPTGALYVAKLSELRDRIISACDQYMSEDQILETDKIIHEPPIEIPVEEKPTVSAIEKTRDLDPRFRYIDDLSKLERELNEIITDLQGRVASTIEDAAERWSRRYEVRKADLVDKIESAASSRSLITAFIGTVVTTIVSGLLGNVVKAASDLFVHAK